MKKGELNEAADCYRRAIQLNPKFVDSYIKLGNVLLLQGRLDEALSYYQKSIEIDPNFSGAHYNLGVALQEQGKLDEAIACYQKALQLNPNYVDAYHDLGFAFQEQGKLDEAIACYQKALQLNPNLVNAYDNLGITFQEQGKLDEAIACYQKALQLNPNLVNTYDNLGITFQEQGKLDEAIACYQKALQLNPNYSNAHWNLSLAFLLSGNFREGWREHEWRWKLKDFSFPRNFSHTIWDGSDIMGLTILLHAECGLGDTIHFIRYAPLVAQKGAKIIVECQKELKTLLRNIKEINQVIVQGEQIPEFDIHCPVLSLPLLFNTTLETIPAKIPYITADSVLVHKWREKVRHDNSKLKIGLVWSGNPRYKRNRYRSFSLDTFSPLAQLDEITLYSLQKGEAGEQAENPPENMKLIDYTKEINDFSDTAALLENLDLITSVDTSVAHLAGALGKPVWTLIPFAPDWRWMVNRDDSPWYPTMRLFRQPSPGDWESVMVKVKDELLKLLNKN